MKTEELVLVVVIAMAVLFLVSGFFGNWSSGSGMMGMMSGAYGFGSFGMWLFGWLFMTLIIIALILGIIWLIKQIQKK